MGREIERKFLVTGDGWREQATGPSHIVQGYLHV
ncbi:MAG: CYTH domain protein, partial [Nitriliruptoraceae bacterium]